MNTTSNTARRLAETSRYLWIDAINEEFENKNQEELNEIANELCRAGESLIRSMRLAYAKAREIKNQNEEN